MIAPGRGSGAAGDAGVALRSDSYSPITCSTYTLAYKGTSTRSGSNSGRARAMLHVDPLSNKPCKIAGKHNRKHPVDRRRDVISWAFTCKQPNECSAGRKSNPMLSSRIRELNQNSHFELSKRPHYILFERLQRHHLSLPRARKRQHGSAPSVL